MPEGDGPEHLLLSTGHYARAMVNELPRQASAQAPHWIDFLRVDSAVDAAAKARTLGGRVLVEPHRDRQGGMLALLAGPDGAPIGVMEWSDSLGSESPK